MANEFSLIIDEVHKYECDYLIELHNAIDSEFINGNANKKPKGILSDSVENAIQQMEKFESVCCESKVKGNKRNGTQDRQQAFKNICK